MKALNGNTDLIFDGSKGVIPRIVAFRSDRDPADL